MPAAIQSMVYAGATPWHRLGTPIPANGTWDEIREAAGFYDVREEPLTLQRNGFPIPDKKAIVRADTGDYLSTVGSDYCPLQFEELAQAGLTAAHDVQAIWHTAGTLGPHGVRGWLLAELPEPIRVRGDSSETRKYVLLTTAHDGLTAAILANVATRVVCQNTLGAALKERGGARWTIRHTPNAKARLEEAARAFKYMMTEMADFEVLANVLAVQKYTLEQHKAVVDSLIPVPKDDKPHPRLEKDRAAVMALFDTFTGADAGILGTGYGALQAWTEFAKLKAPLDGDAREARTARRLMSATVGEGATKVSRALGLIIEQTGVYARNPASLPVAA
jgi:phage/plasmid-like protein (TIGR03299 family)